MTRYLWVPLFLCFVCVSSGCVSWKPSWDRSLSAGNQELAADLLNVAEEMSLHAVSLGRLNETISAYKQVSDEDPANYQALTSLGHLYILKGAAYTEEVRDKVSCFREAMVYNELAMYTHPDFKNQVDKGIPPWEAVYVLSKDEMEAMFYWVTAMLYYFKEGMSYPQKAINLKWIKRCGTLLHHMEELDGTWGGGGIQFSLALYYGILPGFLGGDPQKSDDYLERAFITGPGWLLNHWGRAKYFHVENQNREGFIDDLNWVLNQDIDTAGGFYPWKIYFRNDARIMLDHTDLYFK